MSQCVIPTTQGNSNAAAGALYYNTITRKLMIYDGAMWFPVNEKLCIVCHMVYHEYEDVGHPWIDDNLTYLEWKLAQKERSEK